MPVGRNGRAIAAMAPTPLLRFAAQPPAETIDSEKSATRLTTNGPFAGPASPRVCRCELPQSACCSRVCGTRLIALGVRRCPDGPRARQGLPGGPARRSRAANARALLPRRISAVSESSGDQQVDRCRVCAASCPDGAPILRASCCCRILRTAAALPRVTPWRQRSSRDRHWRKNWSVAAAAGDLPGNGCDLAVGGR